MGKIIMVEAARPNFIARVQSSGSNIVMFEEAPPKFIAKTQKVTLIGNLVSHYPNARVDAIENTINERLGEIAAIKEVPDGVIDGINKVFELSAEPASPEWLWVYVGGQVKNNYTLVGKVITFDQAPPEFVSLVAQYALQTNAAAFARITVGSTPPVNPRINDLWIDTNN